MADENTTASAPPADFVVQLIALGVKAVTEEIAKKIEEELGATSLEELAGLSVDDLTAPGIGLKKAPAVSLMTKVRVAAAPSAPAPAPAAAAASAVSAASFDVVLPSIPTEESWLSALKAGGVLKVDQSTVIGAVRATLAYRYGLFNVPAKLAAAMEEYAEGATEAVPSEFFKIRKGLIRRNYAEIFEAVEGLDGNFVTEGRKKELFRRIDQYLWPAIIEFFKQLEAWYKQWLNTSSAPGALISGITALSGLRAGGILPSAAIMQPPDTGILYDQADAVADAINRVFAGTGAQITSALAWDAKQIVESLGNSNLHQYVGAPNRDTMLRQLGVAVPPTYPRTEQNLVRFVLSIMRVKDQPTGSRESLQYFEALYVLGSTISWDQLTGAAVPPPDGRPLTGIGGTARNGLGRGRRGDDRDDEGRL